MESRNIVAIEIASSKVKGAVASVGPDGSITVLAAEERPAVNNVRYGRVQNIREVSGAVADILQALQEAPGVAPRKVKALAVALGGRSLSASAAKASLKFPHECEITDSQVQRLIYEATRDFMGDKNIEATVPRKFFVNNTAVTKAVGNFGTTLRGEFMMLTCGKETRQNLDRVRYGDVEAKDITYILRPTAIADFVLTADERQLGCALVDFGAETTTVSVYKDGTLAFLCTLPMGSRLITLDLKAGLGVTEETAENYKLTVGSLAENNAADTNGEEINAYVRARAGEIAANIVNQLELAGYNAENLASIVLTGGGAQLPEFSNLLAAQCKLPVRVAEMPGNIVFRVAGRNNPANIDIMALVCAAARIPDYNCLEMPVAEEFVSFFPEEDKPILFKEDDEEEKRETLKKEDKKEEYQPVVATKGPRKPPTEDDDDLLDDDEDDEEEELVEEQPKTKKRGFFHFGRKKNKYEEEEQEEEFEEEEEEEEEIYEEPEPDNDPDNYNKTRRSIDDMLSKFSGLFTTKDEDIY